MVCLQQDSKTILFSDKASQMLIEKEKIHSFTSVHATAVQTPLVDASSWVEIDKKALEHNLSMYKAVVGSALLAPVIKSNAYGHGFEQVATVCDTNEHVDMLCVVSLHEALVLRSIGIKKPIVVISIVIGNLEEAIKHDIDLIVYDFDTVLTLNTLGKGLNKKANIHIKIDTGLSRLGLLGHQVLHFIKQVHALPYVSIQGIFTHLAESESQDQTFTNQQLKQFADLLAHIEKMGIYIQLKHAACSAAITMNAGSLFSMVRVGIGMYGLWPSEDTKQVAQRLLPNFHLKPVLTWKTRILQVKDIPSGSYVGYDRTHCVNVATRIAILPVGYWDGYDRGLSNKGHALVNGLLAPVLGRIAMNLCMIDITGLEVGAGCEVTLLGAHPGITAEDLALSSQTINYEFVTRINPLLPRRVIP